MIMVDFSRVGLASRATALAENRGHLVLGLLLGPLADRAFDQAKGPAVALVAVLLAGTVLFWLIRRRRRGASAAWTEASCPVCVGVTLLSDRIPALTDLGDLSARRRP